MKPRRDILIRVKGPEADGNDSSYDRTQCRDVAFGPFSKSASHPAHIKGGQKEGFMTWKGERLRQYEGHLRHYDNEHSMSPDKASGVCAGRDSLPDVCRSPLSTSRPPFSPDLWNLHHGKWKFIPHSPNGNVWLKTYGSGGNWEKGIRPGIGYDLLSHSYEAEQYIPPTAPRQLYNKGDAEICLEPFPISILDS